MPNKHIEIESPQGKSKKNTLFKLIFVLVNIATIIILMAVEFGKGSMADFDAAMTVLSNNVEWLLLALLAFIVKVLADIMSYFILIRDVTGESRFTLSFKIAIIGKYGDGITPMGTGGQPFQMYYLHKYNIELSQAASIPLARTAVKVMGFNLTMLFFFVVFPQTGAIGVKIAAYVALFINSLMPVVLLFLSFKRGIAHKIVDKLLTLGVKFRIVKNYEKAHSYFHKKVEDMLVSIKYFNTHMPIFLSLFFLSILELMCFMSIPYLVYRAYGGGGEISWIFAMTSAMYIFSASILAPTPGTSGVTEGFFYAIFSTVITGGMLVYALFTWRIITFYFFIIGGFFLIIYESIKKTKAHIDARDERKGRITNRMRKEQEKTSEEPMGTDNLSK
jgi:uncharacterized protein (TIRG00374 family)